MTGEFAIDPLAACNRLLQSRPKATFLIAARYILEMNGNKPDIITNFDYPPLKICYPFILHEINYAVFRKFSHRDDHDYPGNHLLR
jgi:hypothetical protein